ncbi:MAG TPA: hypothetical protein VE377_16875 [Candidatus Dormibacteraeota bacterium]|nr:hypothetical protein [Candidatus Dormibacteraeota bacterium]
MTDSSLTPSPQFGTAEYVGTPGGDHCHFCHQPIGATYYRVNASMACPSCADRVRTELGFDSASAFTRALLFGVGAAALGLVLYSAFMIITRISIGYASLAVGWMVGTAMIKGSGGIAGRRYQIVAAVLTYVSCTLARIPVWLHYTPGLSIFDVRLIPDALIFPFTRFGDNPFGGVMGLVILFVGVSIAVRLTAPKAVVVDGPFDNSVKPRG